MRIFLYILAVILAIGLVLKEALSKPQDPRKKWLWRVGMGCAFIFALIITLNLPDPEQPKPLSGIETADIVGEAVGEAMDPLTCSMDSLHVILLKMAGTEQDQEQLRQLAFEQALCLATIARSAIDSGLVALGLSEYDDALSHLNYGIQAAKTDSLKQEALMAKALAGWPRACPGIISLVVQSVQDTAPTASGGAPGTESFSGADIFAGRGRLRSRHL